jgi:hypothetical protein
MKFSEFVDKNPDVSRKLRKRILPEFVDAPISSTDGGLDKHGVSTSIGFGLSKMQLKRVFDYVKSWLIRYELKYESINPYLTVSRVDGDYKRDKLIKALKKVRENHIFKPDGVFILREDDTDFIIIEYVYNHNFVGQLNECISHFKLAKREQTCYIKLFSIEAESFPLHLFDQMIYSLPNIPDIRAGSVGLKVRRK